MKIGDLVKYDRPRRWRRASVPGPPTSVGTIIERMPDIDPSYVAWRVLLHDEIQVIHESFLEVVK